LFAPLAAAAVALAATVTPAAPIAKTAPPVVRAAPSVPDWSLKTEMNVAARGTMAITDAQEVGRPLAADNTRLPGFTTMEQRLRAGGEIHWERRAAELNSVRLRVQVDAFNGPSQRKVGAVERKAPQPGGAGLDPDTALAVDPIHKRDTGWNADDKHLLRRFDVEFATRWGRLLAGRTVSTWGLGLLAQGGQDEDLQFGFKRRGVIVDRVQATLIPAAIPGDGSWAAAFPIALVLAADHVVEDDLARAADGDDAENLIAALFVKHLQWEFGLYGVRRTQIDRRGLTINAWVSDIYGRAFERFGKWQVELAGEFLSITGDTTYFRTAYNPDKLKIDQFGGVLRLTVKRKTFAIRVEGGVASGDQDPFDDTVRNFKFAADYRVGLVLFSDVMRRATANTAANLTDPRFAGQPPAGYERLASGGAVTQAIYIHPVARVGPWHGLAAQVGWLFAQAPAPLVDPYFSSLKGGEAIGPNGGTASTDLGSEIDAAVWYELDAGPVRAMARVDWGSATLGKAFADRDGKVGPDVSTVLGQLLVRGTW